MGRVQVSRIPAFVLSAAAAAALRLTQLPCSRSPVPSPLASFYQHITSSCPAQDTKASLGSHMLFAAYPGLPVFVRSAAPIAVALRLIQLPGFVSTLCVLFPLPSYCTCGCI